MNSSFPSSYSSHQLARASAPSNWARSLTVQMVSKESPTETHACNKPLWKESGSTSFSVMI